MWLNGAFMGALHIILMYPDYHIVYSPTHREQHSTQVSLFCRKRNHYWILMLILNWHCHCLMTFTTGSMKELSKTEIFFKKKKHVLVLTLLSTQHSACYHIHQEGDRRQQYNGGDYSFLSCTSLAHACSCTCMHFQVYIDSLLQFCCWENWPFSMVVINELLMEVSGDVGSNVNMR